MRPSTPAEELLFLAMFIALFAVILTLLNHLLLPHNYNKMVVLTLTSILVALFTIFARKWYFARRS
ncbi:MAG: hypothetical protein GIW97_06050 [Candidatus Eremiobacteraeota bacterium]|nr:hypothetical protein [Candidatus Eremiobacteraeota bacterium]